MTFDFAPHWLTMAGTATPYSGDPGMLEVAALVEELFTEGTLSYEQLCSLSTVPELAALLGDTLHSVPAGRRFARQK